MSRRGEDASLDRHLAWLKSIGASDVDGCTCEHTLRGGRLHGVDLMKSWVRLSDDPCCSVHGDVK